MVKVYWSISRILISLVHNLAEVVNEVALSLKLFHSFSVLLSNIFSRFGIESCVYLLYKVIFTS